MSLHLFTSALALYSPTGSPKKWTQLGPSLLFTAYIRVKGRKKARPEGDNKNGQALDEILEGLEKALILRAYKGANGVKTETARKLGIKTSALYYKLAKYGITDDDAK